MSEVNGIKGAIKGFLPLERESTRTFGVDSKKEEGGREEVKNLQDKRLMEVSRLYEKHFLRELLKAMRKTVSESQFTQPSFSEKIYKQQLDEEYVEKWGDQGGIGLSDVIYKNLKERLGTKD